MELRISGLTKSSRTRRHLSSPALPQSEAVVARIASIRAAIDQLCIKDEFEQLLNGSDGVRVYGERCEANDSRHTGGPWLYPC